MEWRSNVQGQRLPHNIRNAIAVTSRHSENMGLIRTKQILQ